MDVPLSMLQVMKLQSLHQIQLLLEAGKMRYSHLLQPENSWPFKAISCHQKGALRADLLKASPFQLRDPSWWKWLQQNKGLKKFWYKVTYIQVWQVCNSMYVSRWWPPPSAGEPDLWISTPSRLNVTECLVDTMLKAPTCAVPKGPPKQIERKESLPYSNSFYWWFCCFSCYTASSCAITCWAPFLGPLFGLQGPKIALKHLFAKINRARNLFLY